MRKGLKLRLSLITFMTLIALIYFLGIAKPYRPLGQNDRHSIVSQFLYGNPPFVDVELGWTLAGTIVVLLPLAVAFLVVDLWGLGTPPVEHVGCFAMFLVGFAINVIVSLGIWTMFGGWGLPTIAPVIILILLGTLIAAAISEWRIFHALPECNEKTSSRIE